MVAMEFLVICMSSSLIAFPQNAGLAERRGGSVARLHLLRRRICDTRERPSLPEALPFPEVLQVFAFDL